MHTAPPETIPANIVHPSARKHGTAYWPHTHAHMTGTPRQTRRALTDYCC
jgi:hypothetical protein